MMYLKKVVLFLVKKIAFKIKKIKIKTHKFKRKVSVKYLNTRLNSVVRDIEEN